MASFEDRHGVIVSIIALVTEMMDDGPEKGLALEWLHGELSCAREILELAAQLKVDITKQSGLTDANRTLLLVDAHRLASAANPDATLGRLYKGLAAPAEKGEKVPTGGRAERGPGGHTLRSVSEWGEQNA